MRRDILFRAKAWNLFVNVFQSISFLQTNLTIQTYSQQEKKQQISQKTVDKKIALLLYC
jgi:hypothetical protein